MSMRTISKAVVLATATVALASGAAMAAPADQADQTARTAAVRCTGWKEIRVDNNAAGAKYRECDTGSGPYRKTSAEIYLWDNKHDGKIAQVHVRAGWGSGDVLMPVTWHHYYGWGDESHHSPLIKTGWHRGNEISVRLAAVRG